MFAAAAGSQPCEHPVETTTTFQTVTPFSDTARLNWIEQRFVCITGSGVSGVPPTRWIVDDMDVPDFAGTGATLREAIDSAMKGEQGPLDSGTPQAEKTVAIIERLQRPVDGTARSRRVSKRRAG